jgi:hypothetical protein
MREEAIERQISNGIGNLSLNGAGNGRFGRPLQGN